MKLFSDLFWALDSTNSTNEKIQLLKKYFNEASPDDKIWALALFTGRRPKRKISTAQIRQWAIEMSGVPTWLFEESYHSVGDLGETISLLVSRTTYSTEQNLAQWFEAVINIPDKDEEAKKSFTLKAWHSLSRKEILVFNKLLMGSLRVGVSQILVIKALSEWSGVPSPVITHRLMGNWDPAKIRFDKLIFSEHSEEVSTPYPFFLAYPIENDGKELGEVNEWFAEWKWDGIRAQVIKRKGELFIWSRGEELVTDKFPELTFLKNELPDGTVLDGEMICLEANEEDIIKPHPFSLLQARISRKNVSKKIMEAAPAGIILYDLLEYRGKDLRGEAHEDRRQLLEECFACISRRDKIKLSPILSVSTWDDLKNLQLQSRDYSAEGLMVKRRKAVYQAGRKKGDWWKWKVEPFTADAVLVYAQKGHGKRAELYTDYTFAVWGDNKLLPFAKAYSGLTDKEIVEVDRFVKSNTIEKFGPVRIVKPKLVFEIGFEGIQKSSRHKSGIAVRFPRILKWRTDKKAEDADTLESLRKILG